jgi:hypothetical protein
MQAFIAPASFFVCVRFFGKGILASSIQDVLIPREDDLHLIVSWVCVVRTARIGPAS